MFQKKNIVVCGYVSVCGSFQILNNHNNLFKTKFDNIYKNKMLSSLQTIIFYCNEIKNKLKQFDNSCFEIKKGGFLSSLWDIGEYYNTGFVYSLKKIPIKQITIELCEIFDINPYRLYSENSYIFILSDNEYNDLINYFYIKNNINMNLFPFSCIGYTINEKKRIRDDIETESFLTKSHKDEIDKLIHIYK